MAHTDIIVSYRESVSATHRFHLADGADKEERLIELLTNNTHHARGEDEKGTISYRFYFSADRKTCVVYEEYADMEGYEVRGPMMRNAA